MCPLFGVSFKRGSTVSVPLASTFTSNIVLPYICLNVNNAVQPNFLNDYVSDYKSRLTKLKIPASYVATFLISYFYILMKDSTLIVIFLLPLKILVQQPTTNYNIIDHPLMQLTIFTLTGYLDSGMLCPSLIQLMIQKSSNTS